MTSDTEQYVEAVARAFKGKRLIWSNEHQAWWRAASCGYTIELLGAGLYEPAEADTIVRSAAPRDEESMDAVEVFSRSLRAVHPESVLAAVVSALSANKEERE